jgi:hypothetical protein
MIAATSGNQVLGNAQTYFREVDMGTLRPEITTSIEDVLAEVKRQLAHIRYGSVEIQIHNGQVVQLESREKRRWDKGVNAR